MIGSLRALNHCGPHPGGPLLKCNLNAYRAFCAVSSSLISLNHIRSIDRDFKQWIRLSELELEKYKKRKPNQPNETACDSSVGEVEIEIEIEQELYENPS